MKLNLEVKHSDECTGLTDLGLTVDMDRPPFAMPDELQLGAFSVYTQAILSSYGDKLSAYEHRLDQAIKDKWPATIAGLEDIFSRAQSPAGVVLMTRSCPSNGWTHAHLVRRKIMEIAGLIKWENGRWIDPTTKEEPANVRPTEITISKPDDKPCPDSTTSTDAPMELDPETLPDTPTKEANAIGTADTILPVVPAVD